MSLRQKQPPANRLPNRPAAGFGVALAARISLVTALAVLIAVPAIAQGIRIPPSTKSSSRQFIVYGEIGADRSDVCSQAEALRARIRRALQLRETWTVPVSISLRYASDPQERTETRLRLEFNEAGPLVRIEVRHGKDRAPLNRDLVEAILIDVAYSEFGGTSRRPFRIPAWVVEGFLGLTELGDSGHPAAAMFVALFEANSVPPLEEFFNNKSSATSSGGEELYRGFSTTLIRLLLEQTEGPRTMCNFLAGLASGVDGSYDSTLAYFPLLGGTRSSAQRWWALAVARIASRYNHGPYSVADTDRLVGEIVAKPVRIGAAEVAVLNGDAFTPPARRTKIVLMPLVSELQRLALRANPLLLPVVLEYVKVAALLEQRKFEEASGQLARLRLLRQEIIARAAELTAFLDWHEATQSTEFSGAFKGYFELLREFKKKTTVRTDPVGEYLNAIERELR